MTSRKKSDDECEDEQRKKNMVNDTRKCASDDNRKWRLKAVLGDEVYESVKSDTAVYVTSLTDKSEMSRFIKFLCVEYPIPKLHHLKRVNKNRIILQIVDETSEDVLKVSLVSEGFKIGDRLEVVNVPSKKPLTRAQYEEANKIWPCSVHENKYLERMLKGDVFSEEEIVKHDKYMQMAVEAARRSRSSDKVGAVVVDPVSDQVISVASDDRDSHPLKHATMVVVDLVARSQKGGVWRCSPLDFHFSSTCKTSEPPPKVEHKKRGPNSSSDASYGGNAANSGLPYLCTGYYMYLTREPCSMCAMALVHSRILRTFYGSSTSNGALGTLAKIHLLKDLNHRFEVFSGVLDECVDLCS